MGGFKSKGILNNHDGDYFYSKEREIWNEKE